MLALRAIAAVRGKYKGPHGDHTGNQNIDRFAVVHEAEGVLVQE